MCLELAIANDSRPHTQFTKYHKIVLEYISTLANGTVIKFVRLRHFEHRRVSLEDVRISSHTDFKWIQLNGGKVSIENASASEKSFYSPQPKHLASLAALRSKQINGTCGFRLI